MHAPNLGIRAGHGLLAVDVRGVTVHDVAVVMVSSRDCRDEGRGGRQDTRAAALRAGNGGGQCLLLRVQGGDGVHEEVPVGVAFGAPKAPAAGLVGIAG